MRLNLLCPLKEVMKLHLILDFGLLVKAVGRKEMDK